MLGDDKFPPPSDRRNLVAALDLYSASRIGDFPRSGGLRSQPMRVQMAYRHLMSILAAHERLKLMAAGIGVGLVGAAQGSSQGGKKRRVVGGPEWAKVGEREGITQSVLLARWNAAKDRGTTGAFWSWFDGEDG